LPAQLRIPPVGSFSETSGYAQKRDDGVAASERSVDESCGVWGSQTAGIAGRRPPRRWGDQSCMRIIRTWPRLMQPWPRPALKRADGIGLAL